MAEIVGLSSGVLGALFFLMAVVHRSRPGAAVTAACCLPTFLEGRRRGDSLSCFSAGVFRGPRGTLGVRGKWRR